MQSDPVSRLLLGIITLALMTLVIQGFTAATSPLSIGRAGGAGDAEQAGRYRVNVIKSRTRGGVTLMRSDSSTGEVWLMEDLFADGALWVAAVGADRPQIAAVEPEPDTPDELRLFIETLAGNSPAEMRAFAAAQLGAGDAEIGVPALLAAVDDDDPDVLVAVVEALGQTGDARALAAVGRLRSHPDPEVKAAAEAVLTGR